MSEVQSDQELQSKYGIVVMLDALGARALTMDGAKEFIKKRDQIIQTAQILSRLSGPIYSAKGAQSQPAALTTFGDNVVITWEIAEDVVSMALFVLAHRLAFLIAEGIRCGLLFRGAVAVGEYVREYGHDKATILGPAIGDVASWHEQALWVGIVATPACGLRLSRDASDSMSLNGPPGVSLHLSKDGVKAISFCKYDKVPLKGNRTMGMWAVSWPAVFLTETILQRNGKLNVNIQGGQKLLYRYLANLSVPFGTEDKYTNTVEFFDWHSEKMGKLVMENIELCKHVWFPLWDIKKQTGIHKATKK